MSCTHCGNPIGSHWDDGRGKACPGRDGSYFETNRPPPKNDDRARARRDEFAKAALTGLLTIHRQDGRVAKDVVAAVAVEIADAVIERLDATAEPEPARERPPAIAMPSASVDRHGV